MRQTLLTGTLLTIGAACGTFGDGQAHQDPTSSVVAAESSQNVSTMSTQLTSNSTPTDSADAVEGTIVRFTAADVHVDVTITEDNPTSRDFLSLLPLTIAFEEFNGREKIGYLARDLDTEGSPGHDSDDGDLIYYAPWGNLGFYYNADGIGHDDQVILLGTFNATPEQLASLETSDVTIAIVE
jgi:hypothetical protein